MVKEDQLVHTLIYQTDLNQVLIEDLKQLQLQRKNKDQWQAFLKKVNVVKKEENYTLLKKKQMLKVLLTFKM